MTLVTPPVRNSNMITINLPRGTTEERANHILGALRAQEITDVVVDFHPVDKLCAHIVSHPERFAEGLIDLTPNIDWKGNVSIAFVNVLPNNSSFFDIALNGVHIGDEFDMVQWDNVDYAPVKSLFKYWEDKVDGDMIQDLADLVIVFLVGTNPSAELLDKLQRGILQINHIPYPLRVFERYDEFITNLLHRGKSVSGISYDVFEEDSYERADTRRFLFDHDPR